MKTRIDLRDNFQAESSGWLIVAILGYGGILLRLHALRAAQLVDVVFTCLELSIKIGMHLVLCVCVCVCVHCVFCVVCARFQSDLPFHAFLLLQRRPTLHIQLLLSSTTKNAIKRIQSVSRIIRSFVRLCAV